MKTNFLLLLCTILMLISCNSKMTSEKLLSVSIDPQKYFLESIVGDKYNVNTLIPSGSNPETSDPTPSQMIALSKSFIYFKVGYLGFENIWIKNSQENIPNLQIVDCSLGIEPIDDHDHGHTHTHGHDATDPHIWSSPKTAKIMAFNMYNAIIKMDAENADYYTKNYNKLVAEFDSIDASIRRCLENASSKAFIIYHPALSYFASEYGLEQYSIEYEGKNPSPVQLKSLIDIAKKNKIKVVFIQAEYDVKNAETIAKEIGAKVIPINILSYDWSIEMMKIANALCADYE